MFPCTKCGACCRSVGHIPEQLCEGLLVPDDNGVCIHLRPDNTCDIYETRPLVCRVDAGRPEQVTEDEWHKMNLAACDLLHLRVYGTSRK